MLTVLEIEDGMRKQPVSVPGTDYVLAPHAYFGNWGVLRAGVLDERTTQAMRQRFGRYRANAKSLRLIAGWLREGALMA